MERIELLNKGLLKFAMENHEAGKDLLLFKKRKNLAFSVKLGTGGYTSIRKFYETTGMDIIEFDTNLLWSKNVPSGSTVISEFQDKIDSLLFEGDDLNETIVLVDNFDRSEYTKELFQVISSADLYKKVHFVLVGTEGMNDLFL